MVHHCGWAIERHLQGQHYCRSATQVKHNENRIEMIYLIFASMSEFPTPNLSQYKQSRDRSVKFSLFAVSAAPLDSTDSISTTKRSERAGEGKHFLESLTKLWYRRQKTDPKESIWNCKSRVRQERGLRLRTPHPLGPMDVFVCYLHNRSKKVGSGDLLPSTRWNEGQTKYSSAS